MKRRRTPKPLSTELLDRLTYQGIVPAYSTLSRLGARRSRGRDFWARERQQAVARIHHTTAPQRRHQAAEVAIEELLRVVEHLRQRVMLLNRENQNLKAAGYGCPGNNVEERALLEREIGRLQEENEALQAKLKLQEDALKRLRQARVHLGLSVSVTPLEERILLLMGRTGLGRSWRVAEKLESKKYGKGSVRNALRSLQAKGLIKEMMELGRKVTWSGPRGGGRSKLLLLSDVGSIWYEMQTGSAPQESELIWAQRLHRSVTHGVAILEVAEHLRSMDMAVEMEPGPLYEAGNAGWGKRAQPDLITHLDDELWPVEVQRKVADHDRYREKWAKTLRATGRLMLVLFSEERMSAQRAILKRWMRRSDWPAGEVWLGSLEGMMEDAGDWWFEPVR